MYTYRAKTNKYDHVLWRVIPEDDDLEIRDFETEWRAKEWADGLCCSYYIEVIHCEVI